jgi:21S rRNA (GM2251-2'-O)-methyltransferase
VNAAIRARRRKLYKLYIHERGMAHEGYARLLARAKEMNLKFQYVGDEYLPLLDKASSGRPHNVHATNLNHFIVLTIDTNRASFLRHLLFQGPLLST